MTARLSRPFSRRAALYQHLDRRFAVQTRFFGAAALVNSALAELHARPWGRWCAGAAASGLLLHVGGRLERVNLRVAAQLGARAWRGRRALRDMSLDEAIVMMEQREVERLLRHTCARDVGTHRRALLRIDRLLKWATRSARQRHGGRFWASTRVCLALHAVGGQLGRSASFAFYEDRQRIGNALIRQLRQDDAC